MELTLRGNARENDGVLPLLEPSEDTGGDRAQGHMIGLRHHGKDCILERTINADPQGRSKCFSISWRVFFFFFFSPPKSSRNRFQMGDGRSMSRLTSNAGSDFPGGRPTGPARMFNAQAFSGSNRAEERVKKTPAAGGGVKEYLGSTASFTFGDQISPNKLKDLLMPVTMRRNLVRIYKPAHGLYGSLENPCRRYRPDGSRDHALARGFYERSTRIGYPHPSHRRTHPW